MKTDEAVSIPAADQGTSHEPAPIAERLLVKAPHFICGGILLAAVVINIANVIGRYIFFRPIAWAEEVLMFMIVWGVFISAGSILYQGLHLRMDLLVINARGRFRSFLGTLTIALAIACSLFMIVQSFHIVSNYAASGERSITAGVPLVFTHAALLVGFILMVVAALLRVRAYVTGRFN
jgi:TRAP-type C4-dicarboxylate transport system permease small subunit